MNVVLQTRSLDASRDINHCGRTHEKRDIVAFGESAEMTHQFVRGGDRAHGQAAAFDCNPHQASVNSILAVGVF